MDAYRYPSKPHVRRHGPEGYKTVASYRPWLRDEFSFRCVYCLEREAWSNLAASFDIEHFLPVQLEPGRKLDYDNLVYACRSCNALKGTRVVPDPLRVLLSRSIRVHPDGRMEGTSKDAKKLIDIMGLDDPVYRDRRRLIHRMVSVAKEHDPVLYRMLLGFPEDLPNLGRHQPPQNYKILAWRVSRNRISLGEKKGLFQQPTEWLEFRRRTRRLSKANHDRHWVGWQLLFGSKRSWESGFGLCRTRTTWKGQYLIFHNKMEIPNSPLAAWGLSLS